jgi:hypothetical protein
MKRYHPLIISFEKPAQKLNRLAKVHEKFDEAFLQELLVDHPQLLPVDELRADVGDLLCIGREVSAGEAGSIDNLYLSTGGYPVIVETKLWRNPQARREVLSQVLDYVKELVEKDFEWLSQQWDIFLKSRKLEPIGLYEKLSELSDDFDQETYIDRVNRALDRGDILALIVGDGIETKLQALVSHLCRDSAHLRYSLGLIELACYHLDDADPKKLLIVPRIIQEVEPVERAYVRVDFSPGLEKQLKVTPIIEPIHEDRVKKREILSEDVFFSDLQTSVGADLRKKTESFYKDLINGFGLEPVYKVAAVMLKVPDPNDEKTGVSVIAIERKGRIYNTRHIKKQLIRWGIAEERVDAICQEYWNELNSVESGFLTDGIGHLAFQQFIPLSRVANKFDSIKNAIEKVVKRIREEMNSD